MSVVQIAVNRPVGAGGYSLHHYPRRNGDIVIYYTTPPNQETPGLAREMVWIASGLLPGERLEIREKGRGQSKGHFHGLPFAITQGNPIKQSGRPVKGATHPQKKVSWQYDIVLVDVNGADVACIDPDVIIINEP